jgi:hypothetical protein
MAPLIEELQVLWRGVATYDVARVKRQWHFTLRAILMWMIHDFLAYGLTTKCVHQRYKACLICGSDLTFRHLLELGKVVYEGSWCWLLKGHPYQRNQNLAHFHGKKEHMSKPRLVMANDTLKSVAKYERWLVAKNTPRSRGNQSKVSGIKHCSAMYDLATLFWGI